MSVSTPARRRAYAVLEPGDDRRELWAEMFGLHVLPLIRSQPNQVIIGDRDISAYLVNMDRLPPESVSVFKHWCIDHGHPMPELQRWLLRGFPIFAERVIVLEIAVNQSATNPFLHQQ